MKNAIRMTGGGIVGFVLGSVLAIVAVSAQASIPAVYTNDNIWTSTHDQPVSFEQDQWGNFFGFTKTGKSFSQVNIKNSLNIRLQKFAIDEAFFYVSDRGIITADSDIMALSIYLTMG